MVKISTDFFNNIFESINLYGLNFPLRYKKEKTYLTIIGLVLSLITIFFVIGISIIYGRNLIFKTGYSLVTNYIPLNEKTTIDFSKRPFMLGFASNGKITNFDFSYINITFDSNIHNAYLDKNGIYQLERISRSIELEYCDISKHYIGQNDFMKNFDYNKYLCTKPNQILGFGGRFGDNIHGYDLLEVHLNKCTNSTENNNSCKSEENIDKFLDNSYLELVYLSESVDHSNISNPLIQSLRNELYIVAKEHVKRYYQYFQIASYLSDNGLIWNKVNRFDLAETKNSHTDFVKEEEQDFYSSSTLLEISLTSTDQKTIYERKYPKLQEVLGSIGGFTDIIFIFFQFISNYFSNKTMIVDVTNNIIIHDNKKITFAQKPNFFNLYNSFNVSKRSLFNSSRFKLIHDRGKSYTMTGMISGSINSNNNNLNNNNINKNINNNIEFHNDDNIDNIENSNNENIINFNNNYIKKFTKTSFRKINSEKSSKSDVKNRKSKQFKILLCHYFFPISLLGKWKRYNSLNFYVNLFHKYTSIEVIIPLIERLSKVNLSQKMNNNKTNYFRLNSTIVNVPSIKNNE